MTMATVDTSISTPMTRMNACAPVGRKKNTADEPMPSIGSSCIRTPSCCPRGRAGGGSNRTSSEGTSGGSDRGGRVTTIWLTGAPVP